MRSGACTVQQTLTTEAASVLKHSLSLARRRGHAQVTPLHVAATLLMSSRASILRRACLKSQNNSSSSSQNPLINPTPPLHCRALELCFNVALNRLPTTPGPLLHGQPSLSNALIAALKRAQAHQRRGCIENQQTQSQQQCQQQQQPPLLAIKVELEQLILSILDDPSVSRVMREAGFSSTAVKSNLEDYSSNSLTSAPRVFFSSSGGGVYSSPSSPNSDHQYHHQNPTFWQTHFLNHSPEQNPVFISPSKKPPSPESDHSLKKDVSLVVEILLGKKQRKNSVIVGDSISLTEGVVIELMGQVERGDVPDELRCAHFIKFQFSSVPLRFMKREEVEMNLADLRRKVESLSSTGGGVIIYAGDLKWTVDEKENGGVIGLYSPVDHLVVEIGRLVSQYSVTNKVWLIGTANYQTFMKCKMKKLSLELQWSLQAVSVPSGGLGLSLNAAATTTTSCGNESRVNLSNNSRTDEMVDRKPLISSKEEGDEDDMVAMNCCGECNSNYEKEAAATAKSSTVLPFWLHPSTPISSTLHKENLMELRRKWNRLCQSLHQGRHNLNNNYMNSSSLITNDNQGLIGKSYSYNSSRYPFWPNNNNHLKNNSSISFGDTLKVQNGGGERSYPRFRRQQSCHIDLSFSSGNHQKVDQEPNLDCLKSREDDKEVKITLGLGNSASDLCRRQDVYKCLQENVPWHSEKMHLVVEFLMSSLSKAARKDFWFLMEGNDSIGKRRLAMAIAEAMFGSKDSFLCFNMRSSINKCHNLERALKDKEDVVVFVEDADFGDGKFLKSLSDGFEKGRFGENGQVIFVLSKGDHLEDDKRSRISTTQLKWVVNQMNPVTEIDQKRKPKWDSDELSKRKVPRIEEDEIKKDLSRQSSSNTLDLNIKAEADQDNENENPLEFSPNSSDLTRETDGSPRNPLGFLETVKTRFVFDRSPARDSLMRDSLMFKMKGAFEEVFGSIEFELKVEEMVLEEILFGFGVYLNGLFEKWLKEVFQTSLEMVKNGGKGVKSLRVSLVIDEKEGSGVGIQEKVEGFLGSNLPNKIKICFIM